MRKVCVPECDTNRVIRDYRAPSDYKKPNQTAVTFPLDTSSVVEPAATCRPGREQLRHGQMTLNAHPLISPSMWVGVRRDRDMTFGLRTS